VEDDGKELLPIAPREVLAKGAVDALRVAHLAERSIALPSFANDLDLEHRNLRRRTARRVSPPENSVRLSSPGDPTAARADSSGTPRPLVQRRPETRRAARHHEMLDGASLDDDARARVAFAGALDELRPMRLTHGLRRKRGRRERCGAYPAHVELKRDVV